MYRHLKSFLVGFNPSLVAVAKYQNFVTTNAMDQIDRMCERYCPVPRFPPQKVAVIGAGSDVGRIASLFLKQQKVVKLLAMYDEPGRGVIGVANDLAHIDTSTEVEAYQGRMFLKDALYDSDVVLICGGCHVMPPCCNTPDRVVFFKNMQHVRTVSVACASFCPQAIIAVQTPPVDCNFALCAHTLKLYDVYDKRRVLGVNAINSMRANQLFCSITGTDPSGSTTPVVCGTGRCTRVPVFSAGKAGNFPQISNSAHSSSITGTDPSGSTTPVVCGTGRCTRVPVFSAGKAGNFPQTQVDCLTRLVREADDIICKVKSNNEQGHLSIGFSSARFVVNIMQGLFEKPSFIDSALVEQAEPEKCYNMKVCATPLTVGKGGIVEYAIPNLNEFEKELLECSKVDLEDMLNLGRCYAVGDEYFLHDSKYCYIPPCKPCKTVVPRETIKQ